MDQVAVQFPKLGLNFTVSREAFFIGDFAVYWYAILIAVGALLAVIYAISQSKKYGIDPDKLLDLGLVGIVCGIVGARLYYVLFNIESYTSFAQIINIRDGGLAIYGGLILGVLSAFIVSRINKTRFLPSLDIAAGAFFIGQAIGRWGNFVNQEAFGTNTDSIFGMFSEKTQEYLNSVSWELFLQGVEVDPSAPVHPCFLYESVWCIIGFLIVLFYRKHRKFDGEIILFYAAWYGSGRAFIEGLRTDSLMVGGFRVSQVLSIAIALAAIVTIITLRIRIIKKRIDNPDYLKLYADTEESKAQFMLSDEAALSACEEHLTQAKAVLLEAQKELNLIMLDGGEEVMGDEISEQDIEGTPNSLEELSVEFTDPENVAQLCEKQIELALVRLSMASELLDRFDESAANDEQAENEDSEAEDLQEKSKSDDISDRISVACEQIDSLFEYIDECFETVNKIKERLELEAKEKEEPQENEQEEQAEEIHDSVSDEADEIDIPSPHANK